MKIFGIISDKRTLKSRSPAMHEMVFKEIGFEGSYLKFLVEENELENRVLNLRRENISGVNITVPYKEKIIPFLSNISPEAATIGAVNTVLIKDNHLIGYNTDAAGFLDFLAWQKKGSIKVDPILLFGTGGAARAVLYALKQFCCLDISIIGRNVAKAGKLAKEFAVKFVTWEDFLCGKLAAPILINATSVSSPQEDRNFSLSLASLSAPDLSLVVDLNYGREDNFWKNLADRQGATFYDGLPLLAFQGKRSFFIWTGLQVSEAQYLRALGVR